MKLGRLGVVTVCIVVNLLILKMVAYNFWLASHPLYDEQVQRKKCHHALLLLAVLVVSDCVFVFWSRRSTRLESGGKVATPHKSQNE